MANVPTPTYAFTMPEIGGAADSWGQLLNDNFLKLDGLLDQMYEPIEDDTENLGVLTPPDGIVKLIGVAGGTPRVEFTDIDETKPAGQYRLQVAADVVSLRRALTADFATTDPIWSYAPSLLTIHKAMNTDIVNVTGGKNLNFTAAGSTITFPGADDVQRPGMQVATKGHLVVGTTQFTSQTLGGNWKINGTLDIAKNITFDSNPGVAIIDTGSADDLLFKRNGTEKMRLVAGGIDVDAAGTNAGVYGLAVLDSGAFGGGSGGDIAFSRNGAERCRLTSNGIEFLGAYGVRTVGFATGTNQNAFLLDESGLNINTHSGTGATTTAITSAYVGSVTFRVLRNGNVQNATGNYTAISDVRAKQDIVDAPPLLDTLLRVPVRAYTLRHDGSRQVGVVSQEVQALLPDLVSEDPEDGMKSFAYSRLVPMLLKAVQELSERLERLEAA